MNRVVGSRRNGKKAGSLGDSASDSGKILSYQRMPHDSLLKTVPPDGAAEQSTRCGSNSARLKQRANTAADPCLRSTGATCRSDAPLSSDTSRSRLSSANLEQNLYTYRNHPQSQDYQGKLAQAYLCPVQN